MKTIRIASASGFWGDSPEAAISQISNGPVDYIVMDYLAELTMSIMAGIQEKNPQLGYATDFVDLIERIAKDLKDKNIKIIANAGGVNPLACAKKIKQILDHQKIDLKIAVVSGDDLRSQLDDLISAKENFENLDTAEDLSEIKSKIQSANAYLGAQPIIQALRQDAQIIVTGRVADPSLALAALSYEFNWKKDDWDKLALGTVGAHIIECGAQGSGGNCSYDWQSIPDLANIGYPIIEYGGGDSLIITKHENTGGRVDLRSVKEQLIYEIGDPREYVTPDVIADFTSVQLKEVSKNKVEIFSVKGKPASDKYKVSLSYKNGFKAEGTLIYTWPDAYKKAIAAGEILQKRIADLALDFEEVLTEVVGFNACHGELVELDPNDLEEVSFRIAAKGQNKEHLERFTREIVPLVLSGPPGATGYNKGRPKVQRVFSYWPTLVSKKLVSEEITFV